MSVEEIRKFIEELNLRVSNDYQKMNAIQLSVELRATMEFERNTIQKIEDFEKNGIEQDLVNYAKMVCRNTTGREITQIQESYLKKIDEEFLNSS
ncbi:MAG: hypothetical protein OEQ12_05360 [Nitrosopumilus sp.]|nr:hypothetical protein [Nitrosopumilus sp.]